jgi:predicted metal-dependent hydrolase
MSLRRVRDIEYRLLPGVARKTTDIVIERDGTVTVRPPLSFTAEQADEVVDHKRMWIYRNLADWKDMNASAVTRDWVDGESFLYLGRTYRLSLVNQPPKDLQIVNGRFCLSRQIVEQGGVDAARGAFIRYYTDKGTQRLGERVPAIAEKVGVSIDTVKVLDTGYRWASCGKNKNLQFHWKCMMAPARVVDYLVVHELCHLHFRNHDEAFWNEVDKVMPDYQTYKSWLKKHGASLDV